MYQLETLNKQNLLVSNQLSTGEAIQDGSEDAKLYGNIINTETKLRTLEGIKEQLESTSNFNTTSDATVASIKTSMEEVISEVLTAINDTVDDDTRASMSTNVENIKESIFNMLNEDIDGVYLFAGIQSDEEAFVMDDYGDITYAGSLTKKTSLADEALYVEQGITGMDIMFYTTGQALSAETLTFSEEERIIDENEQEWSFIDHTGDGNIDRDMLFLNADSTSSSMPVSTNANGEYEVLNTQSVGIEAKASYLDLLDEIINALDNKDASGNEITTTEAKSILSSSIELMDEAYDSINASHAELGGLNASFENYSEANSSKILNYTLFYQEYASADLTSAAIESQSLETIYAALYSTVSKVNSLSLVNYL